MAADVQEQPARPTGGDGSDQTAASAQAADAREKLAAARKKQRQTFAATTIALLVGLGVLWFVKSVVGIEGDAVYIALLVVPAVVFLAMDDRLQSFSMFGVTADLVQKVGENVTENVTSAVTEVGQREAERAAYLGKLGQVIEKEGRQFALIYADVDHLRARMGTIYRKEMKDPPATGRRREDAIRHEILDQLELALTDAFYDSDLVKAKMDVFRLTEPDIAMIVRCDGPHRAHLVAERAEALFRDKRLPLEEKAGTATTVVVPATHLGSEPTPEGMDRVVSDALKAAKEARPKP